MRMHFASMHAKESSPMPHHDLLLGLDVGTTNIKCLVLDSTGKILVQADERTPLSYPKPGWTDFDPELIWPTVCRTIRAAVAKIELPDRIKGIAVSGVAESLFPIDKAGHSLGPAIAWFDLRTTAEFAWLRDRIGYDRLFQISGLNPDPMFGLCKLLWAKNHQPELFEKAARWLHMADYIAYRLCNIPATDPSLACRTLAYNLAERAWETRLLTEIEIDADVFPPILRSGTLLGPITAATAKETNLPATCQVCVGAHDQLSGIFAVSGLAKEVVTDSLGTSATILAIAEKPIFSRALPDHGLAQGAIWIDEPAFYLTGGLFTAGAAIEWFQQQCGGKADFATLTDEAAGADHAVPIFLPHLVRSLTPFPDAHAAGSFVGLRSTTTRGAMFRAVLEGIAFEERAIVEAMETVAGQPRPKEIITIGIPMQNRLLAQIKADVYGLPLKISPVREAVALGVALLAGIGTGVYANGSAAAAAVRQEEISLEPRADQAKELEARYQVYRDLFSQLQPINHRLYR
jgi:xylulokinase